MDRLAAAAGRRLRRDVDLGVAVLRFDGGVAALYGGRHYATGGWDRGSRAALPDGSSHKIAALLAALNGGHRLDEVVFDVPDGRGWPDNDDGRYLGPVTVRTAFMLSRNPPWPTLAREDRFAGWQRALVALGLPVPAKPTPAMVLGTEPVTLTDLAAGYASVAAGAGPVEPFYRSAPPQRTTPIAAAAELCQALRDVVVQGTGRAADSPLVEIAGKTGTTQKEAVFVGIAGGYVVAVRFDADRPLHVHGGDGPARLARAIFEAMARAGVLDGRRCGERR